MLTLSITLFLVLSFFDLVTCSLSTIDLKPSLVILNKSSTTTLICTKDKDDHLGFEVNLAPTISSKYIQTFINHLNDTTIEITLKSFDYIGAFDLICSSIGEKDIGTRADIRIGSSPGLLMRTQRCIVHYDEYIDCTILAPDMVEAMTNRLTCHVVFKETRPYRRDRIYRRQPKLVDINTINKTLRYRWFRKDAAYFQLGLRMIVYATIEYFGTTNYTMDMTPNFRISSNFIVEALPTTDLRIEFDHKKFSSKTFCHGNLTRDDKSLSSNQRENFRTFDESVQKTIRVTGLSPNTWYRLCFHCRRDALYDTISDIECSRHKTLKEGLPILFISIVLVCCLLLIIVTVAILKWNWPWIKTQCEHIGQTKCCGYRVYHPEISESRTFFQNTDHESN